jgi:hypothetical protein
MRRLLRWVAVAVLAAWWASPALAAAQLPSGRAAVTPLEQARGSVATEVGPAAADYAAREARAQRLERWTGGYEGGIYIGGSAIAFALLFVLLVLVLR